MTTAMNDADRVRTEQKETDARGETRLQQITNDLGDLKGHVSGRVAHEMADDIAERFGFEMVHVLTRHEIRQMLRQHKPGDIDPGTRRSFYSADLIGKVLDQDGNELFLTAEASYTADLRDTDRAARNSEFITRFTGLPARPFIASRRNHRDVQQLVDAGAVLWFEIQQPRPCSPVTLARKHGGEGEIRTHTPKGT